MYSLHRSLLATHFFEILTLFIFTPVATLSNYMGFGIQMSVLIFLSIFLTITIYRFSRKANLVHFKTGGLFSIISILWLRKLFVILSIGLTVYLIFFTKHNGSFDIGYVFTNVYEIRGKNSLPGFSSYILGFLMNVLIVFLVSEYIRAGSKFKLALAVAITFIIFTMFAMKIYLFSFFLILFFGLTLLGKKWISSNAVLLFFIITISVSYALGPSIYPYLDRFIYLPGLLNIHYFDFFSTYDLNYFSNSSLGVFFKGGYNQPVGYIIDSYFFGGDSNASTGYVAAIFSELGYFGILIVSIILGVLVAILENLAKKDFIFAYLISIMISFSLINAPLTNIFLSNGILIVVVLSFILKKNVFFINRGKL
jgi:hypothetical protein